MPWFPEFDLALLKVKSDRGLDSRYWGGPVFDAQGNLAAVLVPSLVPKALTAQALSRLL